MGVLNSSLESVTQCPAFSASLLSHRASEAPLLTLRVPQNTVWELLVGDGVLTKSPLGFNIVWAVLRVLLVDHARWSACEFQSL